MPIVYANRRRIDVFIYKDAPLAFIFPGYTVHAGVDLEDKWKHCTHPDVPHVSQRR